jgi:5-carboxymethyl-2-hydroxymuconate isomerase
MPHVVVMYTNNLESAIDVPALCRSIAETLIAQRDEADRAVFPPGGTRVFAYPSAHHAVADGGGPSGEGDYGFVYVNLRIAKGRSDAVKQRTGDALLTTAEHHVAPLLATRRIGLTVQVDESPGQVYDGKRGNLHDLFAR